MVSFRATLLALAGAAIAVAQTSSCSAANCFNVPSGGYATSAGSTVNLTWSNLSGSTVTLLLRDGNAAYLNNGTTIVSGLSNTGQYTWNVPSTQIRGNSYAIEIVDDQDTSKVNYTPQFSIDSVYLYSSTATGGMTTSTATSAASSAAASGSTSASTTGSASTSGSMTSSATTSGSTTSSTSASQSAGLQTTSTRNAASRATAVAGLLGAVALGALAL